MNFLRRYPVKSFAPSPKRILPLLAALLLALVANAQPSKDTLVFGCWFPEPPSFPGGNDSLRHFVHRNLRWPGPDWDAEGIVYVKFKVACDGTVSGHQVVKGIDSLANAEALRVLKLMPRWKPVDCAALPQPMWYYYPVKFRQY